MPALLQLKLGTWAKAADGWGYLGCRVPQCTSSQWFECGCHGAQYNRVGEKKGGPAPRVMDHFPFEFTAAGEVYADSGPVAQRVLLGVLMRGEAAEGKHFLGGCNHSCCL